jgi:hypothetical protein
MQSLQYKNSGQPTITLGNCGNIDLLPSASTTITFGINLSKPTAQVVGTRSVKIYNKKVCVRF